MDRIRNFTNISALYY